MDMNKDNAPTDNDVDLAGMNAHELTGLLTDIFGIKGANDLMKEAPANEKYRIFSEGPHEGKEFHRVANPSYRLQREVMIVCMKCRAVKSTAKRAAAEHFGWDLDDKDAPHAPTDELGKFQMHTEILPLIVREELDEWEPDHMSSSEVERMWRDFFMNT